MKKLIIEEKKWARGEESRLLDSEDGRMCCLGFAALACGFTEDEINSNGLPEDMMNELDEDNKETKGSWYSGLLMEDPSLRSKYKDTKLTSDLVSVNDDLFIDDETRKRRLKILFAKIGVEVEFV